MRRDDVPEFAVEKRPAGVRRDRGRPLAGLYERLVRLSAPPATENGCWCWTGALNRGRAKHRETSGYPKLNIRVRGAHKQLRAHRAILVALEVGDETEHFWDLYELYSIAGFEADHICHHEPRCINPDHLQWLESTKHREETRARGQGIYPHMWKAK